MNRRGPRIRLVAAGTAAALAAGAPAAQAGLLDSLLPSIGSTVTTVGSSLSDVPLVGGVVTTVTGTVGGVVTGVEDTLTGTIDPVLSTVLGGSTSGGGSLLPTGALDQLLISIGGAVAPTSGTAGTAGAPGTAGTTTIVGGVLTPGGVVDGAAPDLRVTVASTVRQIHRTGKLKLRVRSDEAGVAAIRAAVRPGLAVKTKKKATKRRSARSSAARRHSRKLIKVPSAVLAFRKAGELQVTIKLGRVARRNLGASRNARISVATVSVDRFRNQDSDNVRRIIKR